MASWEELWQDEGAFSPLLAEKYPSWLRQDPETLGCASAVDQSASQASSQTQTRFTNLHKAAADNKETLGLSLLQL